MFGFKKFTTLAIAGALAFGMAACAPGETIDDDGEADGDGDSDSDGEPTLLLEEGSTGGAGLRGLQGDEPEPHPQRHRAHRAGAPGRVRRRRGRGGGRHDASLCRRSLVPVAGPRAGRGSTAAPNTRPRCHRDRQPTARRQVVRPAENNQLTSQPPIGPVWPRSGDVNAGHSRQIQRSRRPGPFGVPQAEGDSEQGGTAPAPKGDTGWPRGLDPCPRARASLRVPCESVSGHRGSHAESPTRRTHHAGPVDDRRPPGAGGGDRPSWPW